MGEELLLVGEVAGQDVHDEARRPGPQTPPRHGQRAAPESLSWGDRSRT